MGIFDGIFGERTGVEYLTPQEVPGVLMLRSVADTAVPRLEIARDGMLRRAGTPVPGALAMEHTPPPKNPQEVIDTMIGFRRPAEVYAGEPRVVAEISQLQPAISSDGEAMATGARAEIDRIFGVQPPVMPPQASSEGTFYDQKAA